MKTIYAAVRLNVPGSGPKGVAGYFTDRTDAERAAWGGGSTGNEPGEVDEWVVFESYEEFEQERPRHAAPSTRAFRRAQLREAALAKLSDEEREALGVRP